jgi:hypothetical protein
VFLDPRRVLDRVVDVVEEDLPDAGARARPARAEVDEPAIVRLQTGAAVLVVLGLGRPREQHEARVERRHGIGEHDFTDDTVGVLVGVAPLVVPVADAEVGVAQVLPRVLVLLAPGVEIFVEPRVEVLAVRLVVRAGVRVRRDEGVAGLRRHASRLV